MKKLFFVLLTFLSLNVFSQEGDTHFSADLISNFMFRGQQISDKIQVQPTISFTKSTESSDYEIGTFSSFALDGSYKEVDLYTKYTYKNLSFTATDYMFNTKNIFNYSDSTDNAVEVSLSYNFEIPLTLSYNTFIWGYDKDIKGKQLYSSYFEATYTFLNAEAFIGVTPYKSYYANKCAIVNIGLTLTKDLPIGEYELPIKTSIIVNPNSKSIFANLGFTF